MGVAANDPSPQDLSLYLSYLHRSEGLSYRTILVHKSVVTTFANPSTGPALAAHPLVRHMLKALGSARPEAQRQIWPVRSLLSWMRQHPPDDSSLFDVSHHVTLLLLLASGRRVHDLTLLQTDPEHLQDLGDHLVFWPVFGSKTDSATRLQSGWRLNALPADPTFDVVAWIRRLLHLRRERVGRVAVRSLFVTTRGRMAPASRSIIAGWVRTTLTAAGIDASAGSVRSAVGSSRLLAGHTLDSVLQRGNWTGCATFFRHYFRPIDARQSSPLPTVVSQAFQAA